MSDDETALAQEIKLLREVVERQSQVINQYNDVMTWFKDEVEKMFRAAGPILSMAGPMIAQMMSGGPALPQMAGVPMPPQVIQGGMTPETLPPIQYNPNPEGE